MEIAIPTELFWTLIVIISSVAYTVFGAIVAWIDYRCSNVDLTPILFFVWPIYLLFLMLDIILFPAKITFDKLSGKKG